MEKASVVVIEDSPQHQDLVQQWLGMSDHNITREATDLAEALAVIDEIASGELPCDVVILDGNLDPKKPRDYAHARAITNKIREQHLGVKVIGFASDSLEKFGIEVDADLTKFGGSQLVPTIDGF